MEDLNPRGLEVYTALTEGRKLNAAHRAMALNAARLVDALDRMSAEIKVRELTVINSQGTETVAPLIAESRAITSALSQILAKMGFAELPEPKSTEKSVLDELAERRASRARVADPENSTQSAGEG